MRHAYMYNGSFESNYSNLQPGATTYRTTEGDERPLPQWPPKIDGIRVSYMEKSGKKFFAVRVQYAGHDLVLENPVHIDPDAAHEQPPVLGRADPGGRRGRVGAPGRRSSARIRTSRPSWR